MDARTSAILGAVLVGLASAVLAFVGVVALADSLEAFDSSDRLTQALGPYFAVVAAVGLVIAGVGLMGAWRVARSSGVRRKLALVGGISVFGAATLTLFAGVTAPTIPVIVLAAAGVTLLLLAGTAEDRVA